MNETSPWSLALAALPALAAVIKVIWPGERRGVGHRLSRILEMCEKTPEGAGRTALAEVASKLAQQLAYLEDRRLRRKVDGASIAALTFIVVVGGGLGGLLMLVDHVLATIGAVSLIVVVVIFIFVGAPQTLKTAETYPYEKDAEKGRRPPRQ